MDRKLQSLVRLAVSIGLTTTLWACGSPAGTANDSASAVVTAPPAVSRIDLLAGQIGGAGNLDGVGGSARFDHPADAAADSHGNVYVADYNNSTIRRIAADGTVTTLAGKADVPGSADGPGAQARFNHPQNIAIDQQGTLFVSDTWNNTVRKITPDGQVSTLAGTPGVQGSSDGSGAAASFNIPGGLVVDAQDNVFVTDSSNNTLREISPTGYVTTIAGTPGISGSADGVGAQASFNLPTFLALDGNGDIYLADSWNNTIRKITAGGVVTTVAGQAGAPGSTDGVGNAARFNFPFGLAVDPGGALYVADSGNESIRKVSPGGQVTTVAGEPGTIGSSDGPALSASFNNPLGLTRDNAGNLYAVDNGNNTVRKIGADGSVSTIAGAAAVPGAANGSGADARFNVPAGLAADAAGNLYVADCYNSTIRKIDPTGLVSTLAGIPGQTGSADGPALAATFDHPTNLALDKNGNILVADSRNNTVRVISPGGTVSTLAGTPGLAGTDDGTGASAHFYYPSGIAVDASGAVYVADDGNHTIRRISPQGAVTTLAGEPGMPGSADGPGPTARFNHPTNLVVDSHGNLLVIDQSNNLLRKITPAGAVTTLAGRAGAAGSADGAGPDARFNSPSGMAIDAQDNLYLGDWYNNTIRHVSADGHVSTVLGATSDAGIRLGDTPRPGQVEGLAVQSGKLFFSSAHAVLWASVP